MPLLAEQHLAMHRKVSVEIRGQSGRPRLLIGLPGLGLAGVEYQPPMLAAPHEMAVALDHGEVAGADRPVCQQPDQKPIPEDNGALFGRGKDRDIGLVHELLAEGGKPAGGLKPLPLGAQRGRVGPQAIRPA